MPHHGQMELSPAFPPFKRLQALENRLARLSHTVSDYPMAFENTTLGVWGFCLVNIRLIRDSSLYPLKVSIIATAKYTFKK